MQSLQTTLPEQLNMKNFDEYEVGGKTKIERSKPKKNATSQNKNDHRREARRKIVEGKRSYGED
jgi:hypothetical protein